MTPEQQAVVDLVQSGLSIRDAGKQLGLSYDAAKSLWKRAKKWMDMPEGQRAAITTAGLNADTAKAGWRIIQHEDGSRDSVYWRAPDVPDDMLERIRDAFEGMQPAEPVAPPESVMADLCTVYPLFDAHFGMHAWGRETGGPDYDLKHAVADLRNAFASVTSLTPDSASAVLLIGGDFFHADDNRAETPASKHKLDVDGRHFKVLDSAIEVLSEIVSGLLAKHGDLRIRVLRGNHDEHSHLILTFSLEQRYREEPRVTLEKDPRDLWMMQWGRVALFAHHGDKMKPVDFALNVADACPFYSLTPHRYAYTGHRHNLAADRIGGLYWERLDPFAPSDSYGASWVNRRGMKSDTYHKERGRMLTAIDPVDRT